MKQCLTCRRLLPVADFGANRTLADGLQKQCRECRKLYARAYRHGEQPYQSMAEADEEGLFPGAEYTAEERHFLRACDRYRIEKRLRFLTLTDMLTVVKSLGYRR